MNELGKKVALATIEVVSSSVAYYGGLSLIQKVKPSILKIRVDATQKEQLVDAVRVIGITVGLAVVAAVVAGAISSAAENQFWSEITEITEE